MLLCTVHHVNQASGIAVAAAMFSSSGIRAVLLPAQPWQPADQPQMALTAACCMKVQKCRRAATAHCLWMRSNAACVLQCCTCQACTPGVRVPPTMLAPQLLVALLPHPALHLRAGSSCASKQIADSCSVCCFAPCLLRLQASAQETDRTPPQHNGGLPTISKTLPLHKTLVTLAGASLSWGSRVSGGWPEAAKCQMDFEECHPGCGPSALV